MIQFHTRESLAIGPFGRGLSTRIRWIPELTNAMRANFERILKKLNLLARARHEATANRPKASEKFLDVAQREVIDEIEAGGNLLRQFNSACLSHARGMIGKRMPQPLDIKSSALKAEVVLQNSGLSETQKLKSLYKSRQRQLRQLNDFRRKNRINRELLCSDDPWFSWSLLVLACLAETAVNTWVFRLAGGGLASGIILAFFFSLINLALGWVTGVNGLRLMWHAVFGLRLVGGLATIFGLFAGVWFNFFVAHNREVLEAGRDYDIAASFERAVTLGGIAGFGMLSVCLLLVGLLVFGLALYKGAGGQHAPYDPYYLYKPHHQAWAHAASAYDLAKVSCLKQLKDALARIEEDIAQELRREENELVEIRDIASAGLQRASEVADSIAEWRDMGTTLLAAYRDENRAVRTAHEPAYFSTFPDLRAMTVGLEDGEDLRTSSIAAAEIHAQNRAAAAEVSRVLHGLLADRLAGFDAFVREVEAIGRDELNDETDDDGSAHT